MRGAICVASAVLAACTATIPEGQLECSDDGDCPSGWSCSSQRCYSSAHDAGAAHDGGRDAGGSIDAGIDAGRDAGRRDGGAGDAGSADAQTPTDAGPPVPLEVAAGGDHSCVLYSDGRVFCWGDNQDAQLGSGSPSTGPVTRARAVTPLPPGLVQIAAGVTHTCARSREAVWCWGRNVEGQLGNGADTTSEGAPSMVALPAGDPVVDLSAGGNASCVAHESGTVRCWGQDYFGVFGRSSTLLPQRSPVDVPTVSGAIDVEVSGTHVCARTAVGAVVCWGNNGAGQLGRGTTSAFETMPAPVPELSADALALGLEHSCASTATGLLCWGDNAWGQLGIGNTISHAEPTAVTSPPGAPIVALSASGENRGWRGGGSSTCAIGDDGSGAFRLYCWGATGSGRLGVGPTPLATRRTEPDLVLDLAAGPTAVDAGHEHSCAIDASGTVWCWGNNTRGQLGNLTTTGADRPVEVEDLP